MREPSEGLPFEGFGSLAELRRAHAEWQDALQTRSRAASGASADPAQLRSIIERVRATGGNLSSERDRQSAENILDYWAAELIQAAPEEAETWSPPHLAPAARNTSEAAAPDAQEMSETATARERIRLSAAARLWRDSGGKPGYLLSGKALADAAKYRQTDPEIAALVDASEGAVVRRRVTLWQVIGVTVLVLGMGTYLIWSEAARREAQSSFERYKDEQGKALDAADVALKRFQYQQLAQRQLDEALQFIRRQELAGRIDTNDVPPLIAGALASLSDESAPALAADAKGFDEGFLGRPLKAPQSAVPTLTVALAYQNFSIGMDPARRMARFTASNVDRLKLRVLRGSPAVFGPDPRLPADLQPPAAWFDGTAFDHGHLVTRQEIAWGPVADGDDASAARRVTGLVNHLTNITPQFDTFNRGAWSQLERWVLTEHNRGAIRVTIMSGPVLRDDDPVVQGVRTPRRFWKLAVSPMQSDDDRLVVDAFMLWQMPPAELEKLPAVPFDPVASRVSVKQIEAATGLVFDAALHAASDGMLPPGGLQGDVGALVEQVRALADDPAPRDRAGDRQLVAGLREALSSRNGWLADDQRSKLFVALAAVPEVVWNQPDWLDLKALARKAVVTAATSRLPMMPDMGRRLGLDAPGDDRVLLQFAGGSRGDAVGVSDQLKALGWKVQGEERTGKAAQQNEVRYGSAADVRAAMLLAADLRAAGLAKVGRPVQNRAIPQGTIEVWISW